MYPSINAFSGVKLSLMPWADAPMPVIQETEEEHRAKQAEEYIRRFGNKAEKNNG